MRLLSLIAIFFISIANTYAASFNGLLIDNQNIPIAGVYILFIYNLINIIQGERSHAPTN